MPTRRPSLSPLARLRLNANVMQKKTYITMALLSVLLAGGCKTAVSHGYGANRVYSGTRMTAEMYADPYIRSNAWVELTIFNIVDLPLCLVADTIIFPVTLPCSMFGDTGEFRNMFRSEPQRSWGPRCCPQNEKTEAHNQASEAIAPQGGAQPQR